jgi:uncharacterized protein
MSERLPEHFEANALARRGARFSGSLALAQMPRLADSLQSPDGEVQVELEFALDPDGLVVIRGRIGAQLALTCQRCLESMTLPVDRSFTLGVVATEALAERLPESYDPLVDGGQPVSTRDMVEDELLLSLPLVPMHPAEQCPAARQPPADGESEQPERPARENPFAVLAELKRKH